MGLDADLAQVFACHRRRMRVAGMAEPAGLAAVEQMARLLVRLCVNGGQEATIPAAGGGGAHSGRMSLLVDFEDVARELHVSTRTVQRLVRSGRLPSVSVGAQAVRVRADDLRDFVAALEVRSVPAPAEFESRAEHASLGVEQMNYAERARVAGIVAEMNQAAEHRGDSGPVRVVWQRDAHTDALERRFASRADADVFAAGLAADTDPGLLLHLSVDDGGGGRAVAPGSVAVARAQLMRRQRP